MLFAGACTVQGSDSADIDARLAAATACFQRNDTVAAETLLRPAHVSAPRRTDVAFLLAQVLQSQGRLTAAAETLLELCRANDFVAALCVRCAKFAEQCDRHAIARQICEGALAAGERDPKLLVLAGHVAREAGDFDAARERYLEALEAGIDREQYQVLGALANTRRYIDPADIEIGWLAAHFADARFSARSRASAGFGLAKAQNDLGDYASASAILRQANAMVHAVHRWDGAAWRRYMEAQRHVTVAAAAAATDRSFVPVFIVGLPRSGTTLTAALLARATGARDRGELRALRFITDRLNAGGHVGKGSALAEAAGLYRMLAVQDDAPARFYIDQDPLNFQRLHIAAAMFPQARVIEVRRDRRDTALSLWSQDFAHPDLAFAYDFEDMAEYMRNYDALVAHWKRTLRVPIHELHYDALVSDTDATLMRLRAFIGAPERSVAGAAHDDAPVQSASVWQARQPVYTTSVGRWRHYAPYVPELTRFAAAN